MRARFASTPCSVADLSRMLQPEPKPEELLLLLELRVTSTPLLLHGDDEGVLVASF